VAQPCQVPNVRGEALKSAKESILDAHCSLGSVRKAYSNSVKKGRVISQKPKPGLTKPAGTRIALKLSKGKRP
jgi:beta-lactam-binding protein with PASTA domain